MIQLNVVYNHCNELYKRIAISNLVTEWLSYLK